MGHRINQILSCQLSGTTTTHKRAKRLLAICSCALFLAPGPVQSQALVEPTTHWAYASFFGTGWYKINDERSAFILRVAPRWTVGEANIDDEGNRDIAYTFRVPMTLGLPQIEITA